MEKYGKECGTELGVSDDVIAALRKGDFSTIDSRGKCFINCVLEKSSVVKGGILQEQILMDKLSLDVSDNAKVSKLVEACKTTKGSDKCDTSYKLLDCYIKNKF